MSQLDKGICLRFYKRRDVQDAIIVHARQKEIGVRYGTDFGKRPDILSYPREILELAKQGVTSFHCSEELWENPLSLDSNFNRKELDELRIGWDLVLDIDCKFIDYSKISADLIVRFLKYCGVKDISVKFSGNKGFHIGVPFEAFPKKVGDSLVKDLFPEAAKKIAFYIKENIKEELEKRVLEFEKNDFNKVKEKVELPQEEIIRYEENEFGDKIPKLSVDKFLEIDTVLISSRHLYRAPYSLHEKSGLISLPIDPEKVMGFEKNMARPEDLIIPNFIFLDRDVNDESGRRLLIQALDFEVKAEEKDYKIHLHGNAQEYEELVIESPIKEDFFPPCILKILEGVEDGKKRAVFILMNFLGKIGWNKNEIELYILKWNKEKNKEPLRENYVKGQLRYFKPGDKLSPNCDNEAYYKDLGNCLPNKLCGKIKNPVNYTILRWKSHLRDREEENAGKKIEKKREKKDKKEEKVKLSSGQDLNPQNPS
ncbi:MAG: DNA primase small subunit domain-containing protein [Nanoarchaeota archaeon]|nr:hypothetical protein [Nanoarchaeota archaeon]MBU1631704.1 hypothetical protein [Nanoarchaeota archaeon]MBU1876234.1 hypothetical protein [Nanoarchaeota archaeon]